MSEEGCKLFVYGVRENVSKEEMEREFGRCGTVTDAYNTGKGYAFITMGSPDEAQAAVKQMHQAEVFGQTLKVDVAKPKKDGASGGGYGGRNGGGGYGGGGAYAGGISLVQSVLQGPSHPQVYQQQQQQQQQQMQMQQSMDAINVYRQQSMQYRALGMIREAEMLEGQVALWSQQLQLQIMQWRV